MFKFNKSMYGKKVRFVNVEAHENLPEYCPEVGTIGIIVPLDGINFVSNIHDFAVQWPKGSTEGIGDCWFASEESLELVE